MDSTSTANLSHLYPEVKGHDLTDQVYTSYPNKWSKFREYFKEPFAEFLGIFIFMTFGLSVNCQVGLSGHSTVTSTPQGDSLSVSFGWAAGVAMAVWVAGGISGAHINPAVTLTLAVFRGFPWRKVPIFIFSQVLGAFLAAAIVYTNYVHAIDLVEGTGVRTLTTAALFSSSAMDYVPNASAFFDEFLGTAILVIGLFAILDKRNMGAPNGLAPVALFILVVGIGAGLGMQTGFALNPAHDLGPRIFMAMAGYGQQVFTYRSYYWMWCAMLGPILGALCGAAIYDALIYTGEDSILNKRCLNLPIPNQV